MNDTMNRRRMLQGALAMTLASQVELFAADEEPIPVIDTHVHVWDLKQFKLPWLKPEMPFAKNFLASDYEKAVGDSVKQAVYMEVDVENSQKQAEADWIRSVCAKKETPFVAAIVGGDPAAASFADYAEGFKGDKYIKGIRRVLHTDETPAGYCLKPTFVKNVQRLGELGLTYDLCIRHADLAEMTKFAGECPKTTLVLDHCGNPDVQSEDLSKWKKDLAAFAKLPNTIGKISGILYTAKPYKWTNDDIAPIILHMLESFGPDRVLFASDWPVCTKGGTFAQWLKAVQTILKDQPVAVRKKLFHDNAAKLYGIA